MTYLNVNFVEFIKHENNNISNTQKDTEENCKQSSAPFVFRYDCELHFNCLNRNFIYFSPEIITDIITSSDYLGSGQKLNFCRETFPLSDCKLNEDESREGESIALLCKIVSNLSFLQKILTLSFCPLLSCEAMSYFLL